jgi:hypothetical protein
MVRKKTSSTTSASDTLRVSYVVDYAVETPKAPATTHLKRWEALSPNQRLKSLTARCIPQKTTPLAARAEFSSVNDFPLRKSCLRITKSTTNSKSRVPNCALAGFCAKSTRYE